MYNRGSRGVGVHMRTVHLVLIRLDNLQVKLDHHETKNAKQAEEMIKLKTTTIEDQDRSANLLL